MKNEFGKTNDGGANWAWWVGGVFLFLAYCNYSDRDQRGEPDNAAAVLTVSHAVAYRECMESSSSYNISDYAKSDICRQSALGIDTDSDCHTEWDGRGNPTVCE